MDLGSTIVTEIPAISGLIRNCGFGGNDSGIFLPCSIKPSFLSIEPVALFFCGSANRRSRVLTLVGDIDWICMQS